MAGKHALLGLLLDRPAYPYQLADRLQQRLGPAWKVNSGQVYQTIKGLEKDGLIARVRDAEAEREDRHVFAITDAGAAEFERWFLKTPGPVRLARRPLLVQITFAGPRRLDDALAKVDAYELECSQLLAQIARTREELPTAGPAIRADQLLLRLNLSADVSQLEGELQWARHAREMLSWLAQRDAVWPQSRRPPDAPASARSSPADRGGGGGELSSPADRGGAAPSSPADRGGARRELFTRMATTEPGGPALDTAGSSPPPGAASQRGRRTRGG